MSNPYATPSSIEAAPPQPGILKRLRSPLLFAGGTISFVGADSFGFPLLRDYGLYVLFGVLLPYNLLGAVLLICGIRYDRNAWWRFLFLLGLLINLLSLAIVCWVILGWLLWLDFQANGKL